MVYIFGWSSKKNIAQNGNCHFSENLDKQLWIVTAIFILKAKPIKANFIYNKITYQTSMYYAKFNIELLMSSNLNWSDHYNL
jgi:hypothetical protein